MSVVIDAKNISKTYGYLDNQVFALKNISLQINEGEFVAITGASGSGKSTLLYLLSGMNLPTEGCVHLLGYNTKSITEKEKCILRREKIAFIFQSYNLLSEMTVTDNVLLPALLRKEPIDKQRLNVTLKSIDIESKAKRLPSELSGGQQQRVAIARAFYSKPKIIFADEPTGNLDSKMGIAIMDLLKEANNAGTTIVLVTHSDKCTDYASRKIEISDGNIIKPANKKSRVN